METSEVMTIGFCFSLRFRFSNPSHLITEN